MKRYLTASFALVVLAVLTACGGASMQNSFVPSQPQAPMAEQGLSQIDLMLLQAPRYRACPQERRGEMRCYAILSTFAMVDPRASCLHHPGCFGPVELQGAYGMTSAATTGGKGVTVAAVDAYGYSGGYKAMARDLAQYRKLWGLPPCGTGCFKIVNQSGGTKLPKPGTGGNAGWMGEEALDVDMISAMCPNCNILLVQASDASTTNLVLKGVPTALRMADIVSNSFGGAESSATGGFYDSHPGKVITASAGDSGAGNPVPYAAPEAQPCGYTGVVCVGGTSLSVGTGGTYKSEVVWDGLTHHLCGGGSPCATGSGCSALVKKPSWQTDKGCAGRSAVDVSANSDPYTGVVIACTPCGGSSGPFLGGDGGTSEAAPLIAAVYALAGNAKTLSNAPQMIWSKGGSSAFHDVISGINDKKGVTGLVCGKKIAYICKAGPGYDGPTGWGSPNGLGAF